MGSGLFWLHVGGIVLTAAVAFGLAYWIRERYDRPAATWMVRLLAVLGVWGVLITLQLLSPAKELKVAFFLLGKPFGKASLLLWFVFVLVFTARDHWLTARVRTAMAGGFALLGALTLSDPFHGLLWREYAIVEEGFPHLVAEPTAVELAVFSGLTLLAFAGFGLLLKSLLTSRQVSRGQLATVMAGFLVAMPSAFLQFSDLLPVPGFEYGQINSIVFFVAVGAAIFRHDLFVVSPFGRDAVFEALEEGIIVVDVQGRIADYNQRAVHIVPEIEDAFGEHYVSAFPEQLLAREGDARTDGGIEGALAETFAREVDGEQARFTVDRSPLRKGGTTKGYGIVLRDQTEIEEYAEKLEWQTEKLEEFASTVSHDLRSPLTVARGQLELARETGEEDAFESVGESLDRMDTIIEDALSLARAGQVDVDRESTSLRAVATDAWEVVDTREGTLDTSGIEDGVRVDADDGRLQTAFENLYRNAIEHGPDDVTVRVEATDAGFAVEDDGPGIPADERERVFERGYTTDEDSTGLGLAIVEQVVGAHGWEIDVVDGEDGGARFEVRT